VPEPEPAGRRRRPPGIARRDEIPAPVPKPAPGFLARLDQHHGDQAVGLTGDLIAVAGRPGWHLARTTTAGRWHLITPAGDPVGTITRVDVGRGRPEWRAAAGDPRRRTIGQIPIEPPGRGPGRGTDHTLWRTRTAAAHAIAGDHTDDSAEPGRRTVRDEKPEPVTETGGGAELDRDELFDAAEDAAELDRAGLPAPLAAALARLAAVRQDATGDGPLEELIAAAVAIAMAAPAAELPAHAAAAVSRLTAAALPGTA